MAQMLKGYLVHKALAGEGLGVCSLILQAKILFDHLVILGQSYRGSWAALQSWSQMLMQ